MAELSLGRKRSTGAFYTPPAFADEAVRRVKQYLGGTLEGFTFYDPACGEGALLEALRRAGASPDSLYGSTLEPEDVRICQRKGLGTVFQRDFLETPSVNAPPCPDVLCRRFVVLCNPPYRKLRRGEAEYAKGRYGTRDAEALFLYRILEELDPVCVGTFNKMGLWQGDTMRGVCEDLHLYARFMDGFMTPSAEWPGISKGWGIGFAVLGWNVGYVGTGVGCDLPGDLYPRGKAEARGEEFFLTPRIRFDYLREGADRWVHGNCSW